MQTHVERTHTGDKRWSNFDQFLYEIVSSTCAVVGFFVGFSVILLANTAGLATSRQTQAELSVDWNVLPPLCRAVNVVARNRQLEVVRRNERSNAARPKATGPVQVDYGA